MDAQFDESVTGFIPDEIVLIGDIPVNQVLDGKSKGLCIFLFLFFVLR
jgi:hypothetical protein